MSKFFIKCGKLFNGVELELKESINIFVEDDKIVDVGRDFGAPEGAEVIDLSHLTVTPGLIDAHSHIEHREVDAFPAVTMMGDEEILLNMLYNAEMSLKKGFTTLRLVGVSLNGYGSLALKNSINSGQFPGSRLIVAPHGLGTTGSHGDFSAIYRNTTYLSELMEKSDVFIGNGADYFKMRVRKEVKYGADFIKVMATGGFATPHDGPYDIQLDDEELKAIFQTAKALHCPVTAHAYGSELVQKLVGFGIDCIEHGSLINKETIKMMEDAGTYLVTTYWPMEDVVHPNEKGLEYMTPQRKRKSLLFGDKLKETRAMIIDSNLKKGYGTDLIDKYHNYEHWVEFTAWRKSGVSALETLRAATSINAEICKRDDLGVIAPGKTADIVAWHRDILTDIEAVRECDFVMKEGCVIDL